MKFTEDENQAVRRIRAYSANSVTIQNLTITENFLITPECDPISWEVKSLNTVSKETLQPLLQLLPEVVIIGHQENPIFPGMEVRQLFVESQLPHEFMTIHAACRSYNLLANEGRLVALGIIF